MPRINRIRIVNFSYNNDSRHILDETFNFHGGENALLNMANGGGKTVLVQLMLQPVVPMAKIQGRPFSGYFRKQKLPTFIMIEWKLDGAGGYLLTGLAAVPVESQKAEEDEKGRLRYFTFTSRYRQAGPFDIANIAVAERKGGVIEVKPFKEAAKMLDERSRKDYDVSYFTDSEGAEYARHLAEFRISRDEWKNVVTKVNDSEGGLEEIFQKCRTSDQLLNEWIIKAVEEVVYRDRKQARPLEEMLYGLVQEIVENERYILEKQILDEFLMRFRTHTDAVRELAGALDEQRTTARRLAAMRVHLIKEVSNLTDRRIHLEGEQDDYREQARRIELEDLSHKYLSSRTRHEAALESRKKAEEARDATQNALDAARFEKKRIEAARCAEDIREIKAGQAEADERLARLKSQADTDGRIRSLEYSQKVRCEERLALLDGEEKALLARREILQNRIWELSEELKTLEKQALELADKAGGLKTRVELFKSHEREIERRLGIVIQRNLLGGLEARDARRTQERLADGCTRGAAGIEALEKEVAACRSRLEEIDGALDELRGAREIAIVEQEKVSSDLLDYDCRESTLESAFDKHGLDFALRFDRAGTAAAFEARERGLEEQRSAYAREKEMADELAQAWKRGRLHVPELFAARLSDLNIQYDTGEAYLRNMPPEIRTRLLEANPVLPYSFLLQRKDILRLEASSLELTLRQPVPLIAFEDLEEKVESAGGIARVSERVLMACLFEGRLFEDSAVEELMAEWERRREDAAGRCRHFEEALHDVRRDLEAAAQFTFEAGYRKGLEGRKQGIDSKLSAGEARAEALKAETADLRKGGDELTRRLDEAREGLRRAENASKEFDKFLLDNEEHERTAALLAETEGARAEVDGRIGASRRERDSLDSELQETKNALGDAARRRTSLEARYSLVCAAAEAPVVEGDLEEIEQRLLAMKREFKGDIESVERRLSELASDRKKKEKALARLGLEEEQYEGVAFDEARSDSVEEEIRRLEGSLKLQQREVESAGSAEGKARGHMESDLQKVLDFGVEAPLSPNDITGDFDARRSKVRELLEKLVKEIGLIAVRAREFQKMADDIAKISEVSAAEADRGFAIEKDVALQFDGLLNALAASREKNGNTLRDLQRVNFELRSDFQHKNASIEGIFMGLESLWEKAGGFDGCYFLFEKMALQADHLSDLVRSYETQLAHLERSRNDMVQQSFLHGTRIQEEILRIVGDSTLRLPGRAMPVRMLQIDLPMDGRDAAMRRVAEHVDVAVRTAREDLRQGKREDEIRRTISQFMASRELLNHLLGTPRIPVKVFKIDLNPQHSRLKSWEEAIRENSGGEKFVVFFSVLAALMAYTRANTMEAAGADPDTDTRVLIMDNPFGPISSEHLLRPMFEIAKKYRTQLICLTDLRQSSIMNCFNLVYMLKIRTSVLDCGEFVKFEPVIQGDLNDDEQLEKAVFIAGEARQLTFFDA